MADCVRVLQVVESYGAGTMQVVKVITQHLVDAGHDTAIAYGVQPETPPDVGAELDRRITLYPTPWTSRRPDAQLRAARALRAIARRFSPDVVHLHSSFSGLVGAAALAGRMPTVYTPHAYAFQQSNMPAPVRAAFRAAEAVVARRVSVVAGVGTHEASLARSVGAPRVEHVVNGIPELDEPVAPVGDRPGRPSVISSGRAGPQRDPASTARILTAVRDLADVSWVGGGSRTDAGVAALEAAGVPVTGWLAREAALEHLRQATVYLHWSRWDGLSLGLLEAIAADVIVVASDIGPNREVLGDAQVFADEASAATFVRRVLQEPQLREELRERQRALGLRFGAGRMAREWEALYRRLAAPRG